MIHTILLIPCVWKKGMDERQRESSGVEFTRKKRRDKGCKREERNDDASGSVTLSQWVINEFAFWFPAREGDTRPGFAFATCMTAGWCATRIIIKRLHFSLHQMHTHGVCITRTPHSRHSLTLWVTAGWKEESYVQSVPLFLSWNIFRQNPFSMTCNYPVGFWVNTFFL